MGEDDDSAWCCDYHRLTLVAARWLIGIVAAIDARTRLLRSRRRTRSVRWEVIRVLRVVVWVGLVVIRALWRGQTASGQT